MIRNKVAKNIYTIFFAVAAFDPNRRHMLFSASNRHEIHRLDVCTAFNEKENCALVCYFFYRTAMVEDEMKLFHGAQKNGMFLFVLPLLPFIFLQSSSTV